jgi:hypothetical protein
VLRELYCVFFFKIILSTFSNEYSDGDEKRDARSESFVASTQRRSRFRRTYANNARDASIETTRTANVDVNVSSWFFFVFFYSTSNRSLLRPRLVTRHSASSAETYARRVQWEIVITAVVYRGHGGRVTVGRVRAGWLTWRDRRVAGRRAADTTPSQNGEWQMNGTRVSVAADAGVAYTCRPHNSHRPPAIAFDVLETGTGPTARKRVKVRPRWKRF